VLEALREAIEPISLATAWRPIFHFDRIRRPSSATAVSL